MITGYQDFYYNVSDMQKAISFYVNAFGFKVTMSHEHWASLQIENLNLGLHWTEGEKVPSTARDSHGQNAGGTLTLKSNNVPEDRKKIEAGGGKILSESDQAWGHMLVFEDIDGNVLKLMHPKY
jgi:predicted enzyme related to lactoylglutathione lyase